MTKNGRSRDKRARVDDWEADPEGSAMNELSRIINEINADAKKSKVGREKMVNPAPLNGPPAHRRCRILELQ